jgi:type VI secretion system secreted protein Hcp
VTKRNLLLAFAFVALAVLCFAASQQTVAQAPTAIQPSPFYVTVTGQKSGKFKTDVIRPVRGRKPGEQNLIEGIRFSMQLNSSRDMATGLPNGRKQYSPLTFTKVWGPSSPQFLQVAATNENLTTVTFEFSRTVQTGEVVVFQVIKLTNASVSSVRRYIGVPNGNEPVDPRELEDISFTFQKIEVTDNASGGTMFMDDWSIRQ